MSESFSTHRRSPGPRAALLVIAALAGASLATGVQAREGDLLGRQPFATIAPQDIAHDPDDDTYWITAFLDNSIHHYSSDLSRELGILPAPFGANGFPTGIAYNSLDGTLLVTDAIAGRIIEIDKTDGTPTGREIDPAFLPGRGGRVESFPRGLAFDATGDNGRGSIYVLELLGTLIYELALDGIVLRTFSHPDDADGFPGTGLQAPASDIDLIYEDGKLSGFYVTGGRDRVEVIRRLNVNGGYEGVSISLEDAAGNVSGILRRPFPHPETREIVDSFICVVESNADVAILEGGEPPHREIVDFNCVTRGREVILTWSSFGEYDRLEIREGCRLIETLPAGAVEWRHTFERDGIYELSLGAFVVDLDLSPRPCVTVIGRGQVLREAEVEGGLPIDITTDGVDLILITDAREKKILLYDRDLRFLSALEINEAFLEQGDYLTGIAFDQASEHVYLFNATKSRVAELDPVGALVRIFDAKLPNLEEDPELEPDLGFVASMSFDPGGNEGAGTLWLVEAIADTIFEIDLEGDVVRSFVHPYLEVSPPPEGIPRTIVTYGIEQVPGRPDELYLGGGTYESRKQVHILRVSKETGEAIHGAEILTRGIEVASGTASASFASWPDDPDRLIVLPLAPRVPSVLEVDSSTSGLAVPIFLSARQASYDNRVEVRFERPDGFEVLEVFRDCERIAGLPGDATSFVDTEAPPGLHEYAVRGVTGGTEGDFAAASVHVGAGAILRSRPIWPAIGPQQLAVDPVDGSIYIIVNHLGDERFVFHFNRGFEFLARRDSVVEEPWQIATIAARRSPEGRVELNYITWKQPVPLGDAGRERFFLVSESSAGELLEEVELFPPRPTNGFVTYPTGLTWAAASDTFYFLERNSKTFVEVAPGGEILRVFPHPAPPFQNFVFNLGLDFVDERGTLFISGSNRLDHRVTKIMEMDLDGNLTGVEIPLRNLTATMRDVALSGPDLIAVGSDQSRSTIFHIKAFEELPGPFLRGDVSRDGTVNLTDALVLLAHLFQGGERLACEDAGDADDNGRLNLTDAVVLLTHLFAAGPAPAPPHPEAGIDPTPDGLRCF